jgi:hypothetical protein
MRRLPAVGHKARLSPCHRVPEEKPANRDMGYYWTIPDNRFEAFAGAQVLWWRGDRRSTCAVDAAVRRRRLWYGMQHR